MKMRRIAGSLLVATVALTAAGSARADEDNPYVRRSTWYGGQTLATDGGALALTIAAAITPNPYASSTLGIGAFGMYAVGAPVVHFAHGQVGTGLLDMGLRLTVPVAGALAGWGLGGLGSADAQPFLTTQSTGASGTLQHQGTGMALGVLAGFLTASIVDAAVLAREPAPAPPGGAALGPSLGVTPEPQGGTRGTVGILGTF